MSFHKSVLQLLKKYGSNIKVTKHSKTTNVRGFIQPLRHQTRVYSDMSITMGGFKDSRYYLYIGEPSTKFFRNENAILTSNGKEYLVHTSECYTLCDTELYVWAVLKPYKTQRQDDYDTD